MNAKPYPLVLFDLDWTLVNVTAKYGAASRVVIEEFFNWTWCPGKRSLAGNPMQRILRLQAEDLGVPKEVLDEKMDEAMRMHTRLVIADLEPDLRDVVLPGVHELLQALTDIGVPFGLLTGTVREVGDIVLERTGLDRYFKLRTYGEEGDLRVDLVRAAIRKAENLFGRTFDPAAGQVVVVGDTTFDIEAGHAVGARVVCVTTGRDTVADLAPLNPEAILPDFSDTRAALRAILGATADS